MRTGVPVRSAPALALTAMRQTAAGHVTATATAATPLPVPVAGEEGETQQAQQRATREHLKRSLAHGKLMSLLVSAALRQTQAVKEYLPRASQWLAECAHQLATQLLRNAGLDPATVVLSGYHQYEVHRLLAALIERNPDWVSQRSPEKLAALLAPPLPANAAWSSEERRDWASAGESLDLEWGYARALARITVALLEHDFHRDRSAVLADARAVLARAATERADRLRQRLDLDASTYRIALLHYLNIGAAVCRDSRAGPSGVGRADPGLSGLSQSSRSVRGRRHRPPVPGTAARLRRDRLPFRGDFAPIRRTDTGSGTGAQ